MRKGCCGFFEIIYYYLKEARRSQQERHAGERWGIFQDSGEAPSGQPNAKCGKRSGAEEGILLSGAKGQAGKTERPSRPGPAGAEGAARRGRGQGRGQGHTALPAAACPRTADFMALRLWVTGWEQRGHGRETPKRSRGSGLCDSARPGSSSHPSRRS